GDPAYVLAGPTATQAEVDDLRRNLGLDRPAYVQYGIFLRQLAQGDLGKATYYRNESALHLVLDRMPATLELVIPALAISILAALVLGAVAALRNGSWLDDSISAMALAAQAAPSFWIGPMLIILFAREL